MRSASHKTLMCNKLCNCLFSDVLARRPALDTLLLLTLGHSGRYQSVQSLDARDALDGQGVSRVWTLWFVLNQVEATGM
jgi:hypothetical protein